MSSPKYVSSGCIYPLCVYAVPSTPGFRSIVGHLETTVLNKWKVIVKGKNHGAGVRKEDGRLTFVESLFL